MGGVSSSSMVDSGIRGVLNEARRTEGYVYVWNWHIFDVLSNTFTGHYDRAQLSKGIYIAFISYSRYTI